MAKVDDSTDQGQDRAEERVTTLGVTNHFILDSILLVGMSDYCGCMVCCKYHYQSCS